MLKIGTAQAHMYSIAQQVSVIYLIVSTLNLDCETMLTLMLYVSLISFNFAMLLAISGIRMLLTIVAVLHIKISVNSSVIVNRGA